MIRNMIILNVPEETEVSALAPEIQEAIASVDAQFPSFIMPGTQAVNGRKLIHATLAADLPTVQALIDAFALDWHVYAFQAYHAPITDDGEGNLVYVSTRSMDMHPDVISFLRERIVYDGNGEVVEVIPPQLSWLHQYSGQSPWET